ncbi:MAG: hypothetical protein K9L30_16345 [Desulfobacterales bacterium]|nr:hypothetical protein [Desulfobacterales bacterium]
MKQTEMKGMAPIQMIAGGKLPNPSIWNFMTIKIIDDAEKKYAYVTAACLILQ